MTLDARITAAIAEWVTVHPGDRLHIGTEGVLTDPDEVHAETLAEEIRATLRPLVTRLVAQELAAVTRAHDSHAAEAGRLRRELAGASRLPRSAEEASP